MAGPDGVGPDVMNLDGEGLGEAPLDAVGPGERNLDVGDLDVAGLDEVAPGGVVPDA